MVLKLKADFLLGAGGHVEHSLPMASGSVVSIFLSLYVQVKTYLLHLITVF